MDTNLTRRNLKFFFILMLISLCTISQVQGQSVNIYDYAKFSVKPGDSMQFRYSRVIVPKFNLINQSFFVPENSSYKTVAITQGTLITITITNVTASIPNSFVQANETILTPKGETNKFHNVQPYSYLIPSFDNHSVLKTFLDALNNQSSNQISNFSSDNTFIYVDFFNSYPIVASNGLQLNRTLTTTSVYNWHTGWLESQDSVDKYTNGTIIQSTRIDRVSTNLVEQALNTGMNLMVFIIPIAIISIVLFAVVSYKRNYKAKSGNTDKGSFTHYLATNFKKQKQKPQVKKLEIDRSLKIIDEILKDSENG